MGWHFGAFDPLGQIQTANKQRSRSAFILDAEHSWALVLSSEQASEKEIEQRRLSNESHNTARHSVIKLQELAR